MRTSDRIGIGRMSFLLLALADARFHLGDGTAADGTRLLRPESLLEMQSKQFEKVGTDDAMGLTWHISTVNGTPYIGHGGGTVGQISLLRLVPERGFAMAIVTNADRGGEITRDVSRWAMKEYLGLEITDPEPIETSEPELAEYVGVYRRPFADVEVSVNDGRLLLRRIIKQGFPTKDAPIPPSPPPAVFAFYEKDRLIGLEGRSKGARAEFLRKADGSIGWLRVGGRIHPREVDEPRRPSVASTCLKISTGFQQMCYGE